MLFGRLCVYLAHGARGTDGNVIPSIPTRLILIPLSELLTTISWIYKTGLEARSKKSRVALCRLFRHRITTRSREPPGFNFRGRFPNGARTISPFFHLSFLSRQQITAVSLRSGRYRSKSRLNFVPDVHETYLTFTSVVSDQFCQIHRWLDHFNINTEALT